MGIDVKKGDLAKHNAAAYKGYVIRILIVAAICILSAFAVELFCNIKLMRLPADIKGVHDTEFTEKVFDVAAIVEGDPENGLEYRPHEEYELSEMALIRHLMVGKEQLNLNRERPPLHQSGTVASRAVSCGRWSLMNRITG